LGLWWEILNITASVVLWKNMHPWPGGRSSGLKESILFLEIVDFFIFVGAAKLRWAGGAQCPVGRGIEPEKTGARSARVRTRGQKPTSIYHIFI
jgi:hypothetical protein